MKWSCAYTSLMEIITEAFSPLYPRAFIIVINSLDSPDNMLTNNALYPWGTSVGKDKHGLSTGIYEVQTRKECHHAASASLQITSGPASCRTSSVLQKQANGCQYEGKIAYNSYHGEVLCNCYMKVSVCNSDHNSVVRIFPMCWND